MADARTVLRTLTDADVDLVVVNHWRGDEITARAAAAWFPKGVLRVAIELPNRLAGLRLEGPQPAVSAREDHLAFAVDLGVGRVRPLPFHDLLARRIVLPLDGAGLLVEGDEAGRFRFGQLVFLVTAVVGGDEHEIAHDQRRTDGDVARVDLRLFHQVGLPDDFAIGIGAHDIHRGRDVVKPVAFY